MHLLVVEDDPRLGRLLARLFTDDRHVVELAGTGRGGLEAADSGASLDAIILDIGLPDLDGLEVARRIRASGSRTPIIMLTARDGLSDRIAGLDAGADDYLTKPFAYEELAARLRALGRRANAAARPDAANLSNGPIVLDEARRRVTVEGRPIELTLPRVLAPRVPAAPPGPRPVARPAARSGLAARGRRHAEHRGRFRDIPAPQARASRCRPDRHGARDRLPDGRAMTDRPPTTDGALVRRVRWRLLAWSGGSTLVVLLALGSLLYAAVAGSLAGAATQQLMDRAASVVGGAVDRVFVEGDGRTPENIRGLTMVDTQPGLVIGGPASGTVALVTMGADSKLEGPAFADALVDKPALNAAVATGRQSVSETTIADVPWRVLTVPVATPVGTMVVQVLGDRTDEQRTLAVLLLVLVAGGVVAMLASLGVGWLYAERALVPIRDAMRRQREFAADASHELRTPLAIVSGSIDHLRRNRDRPVAEVGTALDDIDAGTKRLTALVEDLLVLARTDSGAIELDLVSTDLGELTLDAAGGLGSVARAAGVEIRVDAEPVPLRGDIDRLRQLVVVLVDNAIQHASAAGGTSIEVSVKAVGDEAVLTIDDDGRGLRPEDLPRVFDRFWRAPDAPPGGTGLGLSIARWITERHGGTITAANRPTGGARFEVRLPI